MAARVPTRLSAAEGRRFGLTVGAAFMGLGGVAWWRGHAVVAAVLGTLGAILVAAAAVMPSRLGPVYRVWMGGAAILSRITTPVLMGAIYFGVLTPTGLLRRFMGHNPVRRRQSASGFWVPRASGARRRTDMERQF